MEESFEKKEGVAEVISGYSGGKTKNPTYEEVTYGNTGHFETIEIIYDKSKINYKDLLDHFWKNIDPFDKYGQFCDSDRLDNTPIWLSGKINVRCLTVYRDFSFAYR